MFIKRKRTTPGSNGSGGSGSEQEERNIENPDISELLENIDSSIKEAETVKQKRKSRNADCGCFGTGRR